jgi:uncharacterized protein (DUF2336 family)
MSATLQVIADLEGRLESAGPSEREHMLRSVTALLVGSDAFHSDIQIALFDDLLLRLVRYVEAEALVLLSEDLAPMGSAPPRVVRHLARFDDIAVAGPLLRQSTRLEVGDLIEIATTKSQAHLLAIGIRREVDEAVTDILVERGDTEVATMVATNAGARFSQGGFCQLVSRAEGEEGLAVLVAVRGEMTPDQMHRLVLTATGIVRRKLMTLARPEARERIAKALHRIESGLAADAAQPQWDYAAARRLVAPIAHDAALLRATLADVAARHAFAETVAVLAALAGLPIAAVERVMIARETGGLLLLCRGLDLKWPVVVALLSVHRHAGPATRIQLDRLLAQFAGISPPTAQRVVGFWRFRGTEADVA